MESIINSSRCSAGRLTLAGRWIRAKEDPDIRVVRDRFEAFVQVGSVVTVTGVAVEDPLSVTLAPAADAVSDHRLSFRYRNSLSCRIEYVANAAKCEL
jgi:undecaprenyl pyrophosphate phosphatase UppP